MNFYLRILTVVALGFLFTGTAHANDGGCPRRYEAVVDAYSGVIVCVPKAKDNGDGSGAAESGPPPLADLYMAIVAHPFTPQVWVASGYLNPKDAERTALTACKGAMPEPENCVLQISAHNSQYVGSVRNSRGAAYFSIGDSIDNASAGAMRLCKSENDTCREGRVFYNTLAQTDNFPAIPVKEYPAATLAMPDPAAKRNPQAKGRYWLVSGQPASKSIPAALAQCTKTFGVKCQVIAHASGGLIAMFTTNDGYDFLNDVWEKSWLQNNVNKACDPSLACKLFQTFDSTQAANRIVE